MQHHCAAGWCRLLLLLRPGADAAAVYELVKAGACAGPLQAPRVLVNRSMLRDHYLMHYVAGLEKLLGQAA